MAPPYFNIAEKKKVEVNATCGQDDIRGDTDETYCKLVGYDQKSYDSFSVSMGMNVVDGQVRIIYNLGVHVRNMKMDFNTGGTWRQVGQ